MAGHTYTLLICWLGCLGLTWGLEESGCQLMCTFDYRPVCGSDNKTYGNLCALEAEQCLRKSSLTKLFDGECSCTGDVRCTKELSPHCGSDGKTYNNECYFNAAKFCTPGLTLNHLGECKRTETDDGDKKKCRLACTLDYNPVCGSDSKTYPNLCALEAEQCTKSPMLTKLFQGECKCPGRVMCTEEFSPHCGTDGKTYDNECYFNAAKFCTPGLELKNLGSCSATYLAAADTNTATHVKVAFGSMIITITSLVLVNF